MLDESDLKNRLVHRKENVYFIITLLFSILVYVVLVFSIIGIAIILGFMLISYFFHALSMASIRRNGVRLSEQQFPDIYQKAVNLAKDMELEKLPAIYIMESMGVLNAFASRFFRENMVVVYSEVFDLVEDNREKELMFVLAHEFAHLKRRHVLVHLLLLPAMFIPFLGDSYLRACEYTCNRYAAYYVSDMNAAKEALSMLAIGKKLSTKMNKDAYIEQLKEESGFFAWLSEKLSSHPDLPKRMNALDHWAHPEQYPLHHEKKTGIILGILISIVLVVFLTGAAALFLENSIALPTFSDSSLLEDDEYIYDEESFDYPPIIEALINEDLGLLQELVAEGADIDEKDSDDFTALQYAVIWGDIEATQWLIENGADVNTTDSWGSTPLMNAVYSDAGVEIVNLLLENGADKTLTDSEGKTAFDYAVENRDTQLRDLLK
ncbi:M48 family metallopeptidase [Oceanobacillus caeni]